MARPIGTAGSRAIPRLRRSFGNVRSIDTILIQVNPVERPGTPRTAQEILNRVNEVSFNATLLKELRMIALLRQVSDPGAARELAGRDAHSPRCKRHDDGPWLFLEAQR